MLSRRGLNFIFLNCGENGASRIHRTSEEYLSLQRQVSLASWNSASLWTNMTEFDWPAAASSTWSVPTWGWKAPPEGRVWAGLCSSWQCTRDWVSFLQGSYYSNLQDLTFPSGNVGLEKQNIKWGKDYVRQNGRVWADQIVQNENVSEKGTKDVFILRPDYPKACV